MQRLADAQAHAKREREKYERKCRSTSVTVYPPITYLPFFQALFYGYAYHVAIGLQVFLSALITALSAVTSGKSVRSLLSPYRFHHIT